MKTVTILNRQYAVHQRLEQFNINSSPSSSVQFFGGNPNNGSLFIQFANGGTYIYQGITPEVRKGLFNCQSLGSYVSKNIVKRFPSEKIEGVGVVPIK